VTRDDFAFSLPLQERQVRLMEVSGAAPTIGHSGKQDDAHGTARWRLITKDEPTKRDNRSPPN
jgi:hypothetical protein